MQVEELLLRLEKVKKTGTGKWMACCPAHPDKTPSLAIKEKDGTILLHDFGGCQVADICAAIGVELFELFPPRESNWQPGEEKPVKVADMRFTAIDALRCLDGEGFIVMLMACDIAEGKCLSPDELDRATTALSRIKASLDYLEGNR